MDVPQPVEEGNGRRIDIYMYERSNRLALTETPADVVDCKEYNQLTPHFPRTAQQPFWRWYGLVEEQERKEKIHGSELICPGTV